MVFRTCAMLLGHCTAKREALYFRPIRAKINSAMPHAKPCHLLCIAAAWASHCNALAKNPNDCSVSCNTPAHLTCAAAIDCLQDPGHRSAPGARTASPSSACARRFSFISVCIALILLQEPLYIKEVPLHRNAWACSATLPSHAALSPCFHVPDP